MSFPYPAPELADGLVRLRKWSGDDLPCIEEASRDAAITETTTVPAVFSPDAGLAFVRRQWSRQADGEGLSLAIAQAASDRAVGLMYLGRGTYPLSGSLGYWVVPSVRRRGLTTHAVHLFSHWALESGVLLRLEALVEPDNVASQGVLQHNGFVLEGTLRSYLAFGSRRADALSYSLLPGDLQDPSDPSDPSEP